MVHAAGHGHDAKKIATLMGVSLVDVAKAIGVKSETLKSRPTASLAQPGLQTLAAAWEMLQTLFHSDDTIRVWLKSPLRRFRGETPLWLLREHGADSFQALVEEMAFGTNG